MTVVERTPPLALSRVDRLQRTIVVGAGVAGRSLARELAAAPELGLLPIGFLDDSGDIDLRDGPPVLGATGDLTDVALRHRVDVVVLAVPHLAPTSLRELVRRATAAGVDVRCLPSYDPFLEGSFAPSDLRSLDMRRLLEPTEATALVQEQPVLGLAHSFGEPLHPAAVEVARWGRIVKRALDILGAGLGLIVLLPVFLLIAAAIKVFDPGPIFFRHRRLSKQGAVVHVYKFRSMKQEFSTDPKYRGKTTDQVFELLGRPDLAREFSENQKVKDDPRVSGVGAFLRRTSLDELPQLINALKGDMSLVGPRPILPAELERYGDQGASFLTIKPGITGLWQVSGRNDVSYEDRVRLDIYYVRNWSLLLDIKILFKTVFVVVTGKGAY